MTLREFAALVKQAEARERRANARAARLMALMASLWAPRDDKRPYSPADFMPDERTRGTVREVQPGGRAPMDWEVMKQMAMHANAALGGDVTPRSPAEEEG